jgi:adenylate cyclase
MVELVVTTPDGNVQRHVLGAQAIIGRHPECEVVVFDPMASRRHCRIFLATDGQYMVEDKSSANGTQLNGAPLQSLMPLRHGDVLMIGSTRLALEVEGARKPPPLPKSVDKAPVNMNLSIVRLKEDIAEGDVAFDYATSAESKTVSEDEVAGGDVQRLKLITARLQLLLELGQSLGTSLNPRKLLETCLDKLFEVFPQAERGFILLPGPGGELPSTVTPSGGDDALSERHEALCVSRIRNPKPGEENEVHVSRTVVKKVQAQRQSVLLSDASGEAYTQALSLMRLEIRSVMCAPLISGTEDLGLLYLDTKDAQHRFTPDDVNLLNAVAGQIAVVIRNAELARQAAAEAASRQNLQRYFSPNLAERILRKEMSLELGGSLKTGTVFFSDIVGFTRMAARMRPNDVVTVLNRYFQVMWQIIFARGGTVDKTGGDQIMAYWGVLVDTPSAAASAAAVALEMQIAMFLFNRDMEAAQDIVKPPEPMGHGIGLNTGEFIAGNIGDKMKMEFTVIGNAVNLAQRIESIAGRGQAFIGQGTFEQIKDRAIVFRLPDCPMKNVSELLPVYSLRAIIPPKKDEPLNKTTDLTGLTSRLDSGGDDMLFSLPCELEFGGHAPVPGVVTKIAFTRTERRGRFQIHAAKPIPVGATVQLHWKLPEKPSLRTLEATIENSWFDGPPGKDHQPEPPPAAFPTQMLQGTVIARATSLPEDLLEFRAGAVIPSDLASQEDIIRQ